MTTRKLIPALAVAATCAVGGTVAAATFADGGSNHAQTLAYTTVWPTQPTIDPYRATLAGIIVQATDDLRGQLAHAQTVVPDGAGGVYAATFDAGDIVTVSGDTITLKESDGDNADKNVDIPIPANAYI
jgi:hypothetical protein